MSSEHQELLQILQNLDDPKKSLLLHYARNLAGDTESGPPGPESHEEDKAGTQPSGSIEDSRDIQKQKHAETNAIVPEKSQDTTLEHQAHNMGGYIDNYDTIKAIQAQFNNPEMYPSWSSNEVGISRETVNIYQNKYDQNQRNSWESELKHMAQNNVDLFMTRRCLLLDQNMSKAEFPAANRESFASDKNNPIYYKMKKSKYNLEPFKSTTTLTSLKEDSLIEIYGLQNLPVAVDNPQNLRRAEWKVKINGNEKAWKHSAHPFATTISPEMDSHFFKLPENYFAQKAKMAFVTIEDGNEVVYGSKTAYDEMTVEQKERAKLRGKIIQRNNLLTLSPESYKNYFACFPEETVNVFKKFYFDQSSGPEKGQDSEQHWKDQVMTGKCQHATRTLVGHLWQNMVINQNLDILMSESLCLVDMQKFAACLLNRVEKIDGDTVLKDDYGFIVENSNSDLDAYTDQTWYYNQKVSKEEKRHFNLQEQRIQNSNEKPKLEKKIEGMQKLLAFVEENKAKKEQVMMDETLKTELESKIVGVHYKFVTDTIACMEGTWDWENTKKILETRTNLATKIQDSIKKLEGDMKDINKFFDNYDEDIKKIDQDIMTAEEELGTEEAMETRSKFVNKEALKELCVTLKKDPEVLIPMFWEKHYDYFTEFIQEQIFRGNRQVKKIGTLLIDF